MSVITTKPITGISGSRPLSLSLSILFSSLLLNACAVGPDYKQPENHLPDSFANSNHAEFSSTDTALDWWKLFNDNQLTELINQTTQHNYEIKAARANLAEARALYLEAGLNLLPQISSHANYTETTRSSSALNNRSYVPRGLELYNTGFDAFWEVDFFGRVRRNVEATKDDTDQLDAGLRDVVVSLIAETARNYFELRGLQRQLEVAERNAQNQAETLSLTKVKLDNGRGTELDTSRALAQLETTRATIPDLKTAIARNIHRLSVLCGEIPTALSDKLAPPMPLPKAPDHIQIGNPAQLLQRRPDIRSAERALAAATARIGVATADLFPRVTFVGALSLESNSLGNMTGPGTNTDTFGPKISWAFLDMGRVYARIKAADARAESSLAQYQQTVLSALEETENALVNYNQARIRRSSLAIAAQASEKANQLAHLRYQAGITDFLTVLDTELRLLQDQSELAQSETSTATALTAVYKALGGGWSEN
ncbi:efflux transporter outer membrane subunit [Methylomonas paludis]|uniref:Efflux transporter outer membrane subunit n=1 Tax=Methylomonas paludis TaxID=1173101 RepID=A0A975R9H4_9GAMM|nr:efflux transporter outer membrane subunit [Methylomonas paludis]QWF71435.1 efflux transporter outer membrane subunit [Methylomonas paludis]